ncbi:ABC transporter permease subunit [Paraburkholderia guartelaensis]|uniref:ABC transporter permease subunit n=1 Tax=Paraburkholderia guartelaensis TaxID=2546446 RepID=A0A4R5L0R3_9BURK|nr:ABC transporter permease subunit [Paraburkholderia guartelaensis]
MELSVLSLAAAVVLGLMGAVAKLSQNRGFRTIGSAYTTLIRSVPDLVLMLLIFYSIQIEINNLTDALGLAQFDIDPLSAGVLTLGFIYGACFTETFRGAFLSVPRGQLEAGAAYGMNAVLVFRRILFPQMMRFALPSIGNNWQVLVKATALVSIIGLTDVVKVAQDAGKSTYPCHGAPIQTYIGLEKRQRDDECWLRRRASHQRAAHARERILPRPLHRQYDFT